MNNSDFPKTIWFLWVQGLTGAPLVVRKCYESWHKYNPDWNIVWLDKNNVNNYVSVDVKAFTPVVFSEILRINLLARYGGVWVDATCYCNKPLNHWLYDYLTDDFFVFDRPGDDRMISSWFMAGSKHSYITQEYQKAVNRYRAANPKVKLIESSRWLRLKEYLERRDTSVWFTILVTKVLRVHPYFWFHYLFTELYAGDEKFKRIWDSTPKISADIPHKPLFEGLLNALPAEIKEEIDNHVSPVYKLTWKYDQSADISGSIFEYILNS